MSHRRPKSTTMQDQAAPGTPRKPKRNHNTQQIHAVSHSVQRSYIHTQSLGAPLLHTHAVTRCTAPTHTRSHSVRTAATIFTISPNIRLLYSHLSAAAILCRDFLASFKFLKRKATPANFVCFDVSLYLQKRKKKPPNEKIRKKRKTIKQAPGGAPRGRGRPRRPRPPRPPPPPRPRCRCR